jgi:hypothetical protein
MSDTLLISTRKGLFTVSRKAGQWEITGTGSLPGGSGSTSIASGTSSQPTLADSARLLCLEKTGSFSFLAE